MMAPNSIACSAVPGGRLKPPRDVNPPSAWLKVSNGEKEILSTQIWPLKNWMTPSVPSAPPAKTSLRMSVSNSSRRHDPVVGDEQRATPRHDDGQAELCGARLLRVYSAGHGEDVADRRASEEDEEGCSHGLASVPRGGCPRACSYSHHPNPMKPRTVAGEPAPPRGPTVSREGRYSSSDDVSLRNYTASIRFRRPARRTPQSTSPSLSRLQSRTRPPFGSG